MDYGDVRIGIAFSDLLQVVASPYDTYTRVNLDADIQFFKNLAQKQEVELIVIGLPYNMDGSEGEKVAEIRDFAEKLSRFTDAKILFQDERLSTVSAEKMLIESGVRREKRKDVVDLVAAKIILQSYLDKINK